MPNTADSARTDASAAARPRGVPAPGGREPAAEPVREPTVERFGKTVRWFHGTFALSFLCLAATGGLLALRNPLGLGPAIAERTLLVHEASAVFLLIVPAVVVLSGDTRDFFHELSFLFRWSREDLRWLALQPLSSFRSIELPPADKLNAGQKVNGLAMASLTLALVASGALLYLWPGALLPLAIHVFCFLVWIPLIIGHLFLALVLPGTRPALRGMLTGRVPRDWARHHHPRWVEELEAGEGPPRS